MGMVSWPSLNCEAPFSCCLNRASLFTLHKTVSGSSGQNVSGSSVILIREDADLSFRAAYREIEKRKKPGAFIAHVRGHAHVGNTCHKDGLELKPSQVFGWSNNQASVP